MRTPQPPVAVAIAFVDRVNRADIVGLSALMSADHELRIADEPPVIGRTANTEAWAGYFMAFPDYVIHPHRIAADGGTVAVLGHTTGSHLGLDDDSEARLTLIWLLRARNGEALSWTLLEDTPANRTAHGLGAGEPGPVRTRMEPVSDRPARWSRATVHPDMWADPDDDPRDSDGAGPDGELATLRGNLADYRMTLLMKCEDLDAEQLARRSVPPSTLSLLGLLRHLAEAERDWLDWIGDGDPRPKLYGGADFDGAVAEQAVVDAAYTALAREQAATDAALAGHPDLGERLGKDRISVRALLVHRIEEYARHCGHADLLRERIDGRVGQ